MWLLSIAVAGATTRVALPAGTDSAGWSEAAARTGVELAASEPDVLVTATPGVWILRVVPSGPQAQVAPPRSAAEREAVLILADSLARPVGTALRPLAITGDAAHAPAPTTSVPAQTTSKPVGKSVTTPAANGTPVKGVVTAAPVSTAAIPVATPAPVSTPAPVATPALVATVTTSTPVTTPTPPPTSAMVPTSTPVTTPAEAIPVATPGLAADPPTVATVTSVDPPAAPPSAPTSRGRYYPAVSVGAGIRLDGGPAANVRAAVGRAFTSALRVQAELGYTSASTLPAPILDGTVSSAHGGLALEVGERWFVHAGAAASMGWFAQDGHHRGLAVWPTLDVAAGHTFPLGPLVLAPDIGLRADLARGTLTVGGAPAATLSPLWIEAWLTVRPR